MKLKTLVVVVLVLAVLSGAAYWYNRPAPLPPPDPRVGQPVVSAAAVNAASTIRIVDQGKTVELTRGDNGTWTDASYYGLPADFSKLSGMINDFTSAKISRVVTRNPERIALLDFGGTKVDLLDASGKSGVDIDLGKNADQGGRFVRYDSEPVAYLASLNTWIDSDPKNWADATLVSVKADDVARIEFPFDGTKPIVATRANKDAPWKAGDLPKGEELSADKVNAALTTLTSLRFSDTTANDDPLAVAARKHVRVFRLTTFDGKTLSVALGRKPEERHLKPVPHPHSTPMQPATPAAAATAKGAPPAPAKPAPKVPSFEVETTPAGPVYAFIHSSDPSAPVDAMMRKRAFQVDEYNYTTLPQKPADLLEAAPAPAAAKK